MTQILDGMKEALAVARGDEPAARMHINGHTYVAKADYDRLVDQVEALLHALTMVRDADDDCRKDGLPTIPPMARGCIDRAIAKAEDRS